MQSDAYKRADNRWQQHLSECKAAIIAQYETVQDYAASRFGSLPPDMAIHDVGILVPVVAFAGLRTIGEVDAAWSRVEQQVNEAAYDQKGSLPIGQPEGMTAFSDATAPSPTRRRREFTPTDLYPVGYPATASVWTLMTTDEQADGWHICFTHLWGSPGISVTNAIERLATAVYREANAITAQSRRLGSRRSMGRLLSPKPSPLDPARFHFYDGEFTSPDWQHHPVIPHVIQTIRFELAADAVPMRAEDRLLGQKNEIPS